MHLREADFHSPSLFTQKRGCWISSFFSCIAAKHRLPNGHVKDQNLWDLGDQNLTALGTLGTPTAGPALGSRIVSHVLWSLGAAESPRLATWCWEVTFKNIMGYMGWWLLIVIDGNVGYGMDINYVLLLWNMVCLKMGWLVSREYDE